MPDLTIHEATLDFLNEISEVELAGCRTLTIPPGIRPGGSSLHWNHFFSTFP